MSQPASLTLHPDFAIGAVDPRLYGSFIEHLGRAVYGGIYEPGHPTADADGFRRDVIDEVRASGATIVRYPGGNFVSGYNWEDGVGPRAQRPRRLDLAWRTVETNEVGTDEFLRWSRLAGIEPMMAVNLGTRGAAEAAALVEYCNHPGGSAWSDLRRQHGHADPYGVKVWCLGNEMDGDWQIGHKTAHEYGRLALETGKMMRWIDPTIQLVACGSSWRGSPTFPEWERTVLEHTYELVDYISLHTYYGNPRNDTPNYLASTVAMDDFIRTVIAACDFVKGQKRSKKTMMLSFDEWNVWFHTRESDKKITPWQIAPPQLEDHYTVEDAIVVGAMLVTLLQHADRIKMACLAQLVNVIAPIMTEPGGPVWRQTIFHPFALTARHARGAVLRPVVQCERYADAEHGDVPYVDAVATWDEKPGAMTIIIVNRRVSRPLPVTVDLRGWPSLKLTEHLTLSDPDLKARNSAASPNRVVPRTVPETKLDGGILHAFLPGPSWNLVRLQRGSKDET